MVLPLVAFAQKPQVLLGGNHDDHYQTNQEGVFDLREVVEEIDPDPGPGFAPATLVLSFPMPQRRRYAHTAWRFR